MRGATLTVAFYLIYFALQAIAIITLWPKIEIFIAIHVCIIAHSIHKDYTKYRQQEKERKKKIDNIIKLNDRRK